METLAFFKKADKMGKRKVNEYARMMHNYSHTEE